MILRMSITRRKETSILLIGDILVLLTALWLALFTRYAAIPDAQLYIDHIKPFSLLFIVWFGIFFISGLYEKHTLFLKNKIPSIILRTQILNSIIAVFFFYFIPYFSITPKTNLLLVLIFSFIFLVAWRLYGDIFLNFGKREKALIVGSGEELKEMEEEVNNNSRYRLQFVLSLDLDDLDNVDFKKDILDMVQNKKITTIVIDLRNKKIRPLLPSFYNLLFCKMHFVDMYQAYEDIFIRVPASLINYNWFLENISPSSKITYDILKRLMDIVVSLFLGGLSLLILPFVVLAIKIDDGGPIFFSHKRVGKNNREISVVKFRSMEVHVENPKDKTYCPKITRVGAILRKTRLDELPQLWNVLRGDMSLIGPRPEVPKLVEMYKQEINYYNIRHIIKPGLSGWAQLYQKEPPRLTVGYNETKTKLSYDLYYIKNRSFILDIKIGIKTIRTLLSRSGV